MSIWSREKPEPPVRPQPASPTSPAAASAGPAVSSAPAVDREFTMRKPERGVGMSDKVSISGIGRTIVVKGELSGNEDLRIEGCVEGKIELNQNVLTVGEHGRLKANVFAKAVVVVGEVVGNISAVEKVSVLEKGSVDGDISAARVGIAEGAHFRGSVDMRDVSSNAKAPSAAEGAKRAPAAPAAVRAKSPAVTSPAVASPVGSASASRS